MKIFSNRSTILLLFGYFLFAAGILDWIVEYATHGVSTFPIQLGFASVALTGLVAISAAKVLRGLEKRIDQIEKGRSS